MVTFRVLNSIAVLSDEVLDLVDSLSLISREIDGIVDHIVGNAASSEACPNDMLRRRNR
jgi:hypothetical protein